MTPTEEIKHHLTIVDEKINDAWCEPTNPLESRILEVLESLHRAVELIEQERTK